MGNSLGVRTVTISTSSSVQKVVKYFTNPNPHHLSNISITKSVVKTTLRTKRRNLRSAFVSRLTSSKHSVMLDPMIRTSMVYSKALLLTMCKHRVRNRVHLGSGALRILMQSLTWWLTRHSGKQPGGVKSSTSLFKLTAYSKKNMTKGIQFKPCLLTTFGMVINCISCGNSYVRVYRSSIEEWILDKN